MGLWPEKERRRSVGGGSAAGGEPRSLSGFPRIAGISTTPGIGRARETCQLRAVGAARVIRIGRRFSARALTAGKGGVRWQGAVWAEAGSVQDRGAPTCPPGHAGQRLPAPRQALLSGCNALQGRTNISPLVRYRYARSASPGRRCPPCRKARRLPCKASCRAFQGPGGRCGMIWARSAGALSST